MCYAVIKAKFGPSDEPQVTWHETYEDFTSKVEALKANDHCVSISIYKREETHARKSVWDVAQNTGD